MCGFWFAQVGCCQGVNLHVPVCVAACGSPLNMRVCVHTCVLPRQLVAECMLPPWSHLPHRPGPSDSLWGAFPSFPARHGV